MDIRKQVINLVKEYKYVALILAIGLILMLLPEKADPEVSNQAPSSDVSLEERLEEILGQIQGVGKVRVLLTEGRGRETVYVFNEDSTSDSQRRDAVIVTDADRNQQGLISQVLPQEYLGAVIVCQGGEQPEVRLNIVEAVCDATGLTADKITVLKMK